jgi:hypothetical protein
MSTTAANSQKFKVGRPKKGLGFGLKKPCPICLSGNYDDPDYKSHVGQHPLEEILEKLEQFDTTSKKCNVCKKNLQTLSKTSKTYSGHPCQRILREHLWVAMRLQDQVKQALADRAVARSSKEKRALKAQLDDANKKVKIVIIIIIII